MVNIVLIVFSSGHLSLNSLALGRRPAPVAIIGFGGLCAAQRPKSRLRQKRPVHNGGGFDGKECWVMNISRVVFGFFVLLALTLNFGFFLGEIDNPDHHDVYELFAALVVGLIATIMKLGERSQMSAMLLASSLVVDLHLIAAVLVWAISVHVLDVGLTPKVMASIVSLSGGALLANLLSVVLLTMETAGYSR
jgi:hypothetical protein